MTSLVSEVPSNFAALQATDIAAKLRSGQLTSQDVVADCLSRISEHDQTLKAWAYVDQENVMAQARVCDNSDGIIGPLHGVPVGVKDVLDTHDMPTEYGSEIYKGHRPEHDSVCVARLRAAGAVIVGKTTTTQFASPLPVGVRNPHDTKRTPGVSSSGSAAAVADFMVPLANGTQTGGSVILPAAFCGVVGYKASLDGLNREGIAALKKTLDTLGYFARSVDDIALVYSALTGKHISSDPSLLKIGVCRTPMWSDAESCAQTAIENAASKLSGAGYEVLDVNLPDEFEGIEDYFRVISNYEGKHALADEFRDHMDKMNIWMQETGNSAWTEDQYQHALANANVARKALRKLYDDCPIILTPSTAGEAPADLQSVTVSSFNRLWTLMHGPTITLPVGKGPNDMPVAVQLAAKTGDDPMMIAQASRIFKILKET